MPLLAIRQLISDFAAAQDQRQTKEGLYLVNKLKHTPVDGDVTWLLRNPVGGLSPLVSSVQNSPMVAQGTYRQMKAGNIITRHVKRFTDDELKKLYSPDDNFRISEKTHLLWELRDMERRIYETMEFVGWCAMADGSVNYLSLDGPHKIKVELAFPIQTETALASWATTSTNIVTDMQNWLKTFKRKFGKKPDAIRMTTTTWEYIKANTQVLAQFTNWIRTTGVRKGDVPVGMITPDFVAQVCDWPPIEIRDESTFISYACTNNETAGSNVVIELTGGTWGLRVGDTIMLDYDLDGDTYDSTATISAISPGVSITATITTNLTAGQLIVAKPTFFPEKKIQLIADENSSEFTLPPFGIDFAGSQIQAMKWRGPRFDTFMQGQEPNLAVYRRAWHEFGMCFSSKVLTATVVV